MNSQWCSCISKKKKEIRICPSMLSTLRKFCLTLMQTSIFSLILLVDSLFIYIMLQAGRLENVVGWYHSHPGYGCWLSGIDVTTQMLNQQFQEPFLAVVIDPTRTVSAGKVEIGAFRTYPEGYKPPDDPVSEYQTIPLNKIEDFGVHCKQVGYRFNFLSFPLL